MASRTPLRHPAWLLWCCTCLIQAAQGAGSDLPTISAAHQGTSNANAAEADDASTIYYNPAGQMRLKGWQVSNSLSLIALHGAVRDTGTQRSQTIGQPPNTGPYMSDTSVPQAAVEPTGAFFPRLLAGGAAFTTLRVDKDFSLGFGVFSPGGGLVNYDREWFGRYYGSKAQVLTLDFNPSMAFRLDEHHSVGIGYDAVVGNAVLQIAVDTAQTGPYLLNAALKDYTRGAVGGQGVSCNTLLLNLLGPLCTGTYGGVVSTAAGVAIDPNSIGGALAKSMWGFGQGWDIGWLYEIDEDSRLSLSYRSRVDVALSGRVHWQTEGLKTLTSLPDPYNPTELISGAQLLSRYTRPDATGHINFIIPARTTLGFFQRVTPRLDLMADVVFHKSSVVKSVDVFLEDRTSPQGATIQQGAFYNTVNWRDTWSVAAGANYHFDPHWTLKGGVMFDQTPIRSPDYRVPITPDSNRLLFSLGLRFQENRRQSIDLAYSFLKLMDSTSSYHQRCSGNYFEQPDGAISTSSTECTGNAGTFRARYTGMYGHILSAQFNRRF